MKQLHLFCLLCCSLCLFSCEEEIITPPEETIDGTILLEEYMIPHSSTLPNQEGENYQIYVREKVKDSTLQNADLKGKVILLVHATITPSISSYDLPYEDYSIMESLADKGLDVFTFDFIGYGKSSFPTPMNNPCNLSPDDQEALGLTPCEADYPFTLTTGFSELDEIDTVVDFIKQTRKVSKVHIYGLSLGGIRSLNYAMTHPENIEKIGVQGVARYFSFDLTPSSIPGNGFPMKITTENVMLDRLNDDLFTGTQRDIQINSTVWQTVKEQDSVGQSWGSGGSRYPSLQLYGFQRSDLEQLSLPCLILSGENDRILNPLLPLRSDLGLSLYNDMLVSPQKIHLTVENTGHVMMYDFGSRYMRAAMAEWFLSGSVNGRSEGTGSINVAGEYSWE